MCVCVCARAACLHGRLPLQFLPSFGKVWQIKFYMPLKASWGAKQGQTIKIKTKMNQENSLRLHSQSSLKRFGTAISNHFGVISIDRERTEMSKIVDISILPFVSQTALQRCNVNFLARLLEGEFWEVNFLRVNFSGGLFCWKKEPKNSTPKFGRPKFVSQNSALNSGSRGAKSPVRKFVPNHLSIKLEERK